jgi:hypothetical protein
MEIEEFDLITQFIRKILKFLYAHDVFPSSSFRTKLAMKVTNIDDFKVASGNHASMCFEF